MVGERAPEIAEGAGPPRSPGRVALTSPLEAATDDGTYSGAGASERPWAEGAARQMSLGTGRPAGWEVAEAGGLGLDFAPRGVDPSQGQGKVAVMWAARCGLRGVLMCAAVACTDGRRSAVGISVELVEVVHAPRVAVPWWWRSAPPEDPQVCAQLDAGAFTGLGDAVEPAVVAVDLESLRLGVEKVAALDAGRVPAGLLADRAIAPLIGRLTAAVTRQRAVLRACGRADAPVDLLIAVAPAVPGDSLVLVLYTAAKAGADRTFLAVGGAGGPLWRAEGFAPEDEKVVLRWHDEWQMDLGNRRPPRRPIASLAEVGELADGKLACATLPLRRGAWSGTVTDLDQLAGFGARRFTLEALAGPPSPAAGAAGKRVELRVGGTVAAFPLVPPKYVDMATVPNWVDDGWNGLHPCEGMFFERARPEPAAPFPLPGIPGEHDEDVWKSLAPPADAAPL